MYLLEALAEINPSIKNYLFKTILPLYDTFDEGHNRKHALEVLKNSILISKLVNKRKDLDLSIVCCCALLHDVGITKGRENHEVNSYKYVLKDKKLREWFDEKTIKVIAEACLQHRSSSGKRPTTIYGQIVSDADSASAYNMERYYERTWGYRKFNPEIYGEMSHDELFDSMYEHLQDKFCKGGYSKIWLPETKIVFKNGLDRLNQFCKDKVVAKKLFYQMIKDGRLEK